MAKDSYWFKHDSTASRDLKLMEIKAIHGHAGLGIFWSIIEVLREQNNYVWHNTENAIQVLAKIIDCEHIKLKNFLSDSKRIGLLIFSESTSKNEAYFYSDRLCRDMVIWEGKKRSGSEGGKAKSKRKASEHGSEILADDVAKGKDKNKKNKKNKDIIPFSSSLIFAKKEFASAFGEWSKDKQKYYYDSALTWSNEGNLKKDWVATVRNWASRDEKEGKLKFKPDIAESKENFVDTRNDFYGTNN